MTITDFRPLRILILTLGLLLAGAVFADRVLAQGDVDCQDVSTCVPMTLNATVQLAQLHPRVGLIEVECRSNELKTGVSTGVVFFKRSARMPVVNRGYSGIVITTIHVPKFVLAIPENRTMTMTCHLNLVVPNLYAGWSPANPSAAQSEAITDGNWSIVAAGSVVEWTQAVTFPNVNAAP